jgi:hypothetical protein
MLMNNSSFMILRETGEFLLNSLEYKTQTIVNANHTKELF